MSQQKELPYAQKDPGGSCPRSPRDLYVRGTHSNRGVRNGRQIPALLRRRRYVGDWHACRHLPETLTKKRGRSVARRSGRGFFML